MLFIEIVFVMPINKSISHLEAASTKIFVVEWNILAHSRTKYRRIKICSREIYSTANLFSEKYYYRRIWKWRILRHYRLNSTKSFAYSFIARNSNGVAIHKTNNILVSWDERTILYRKWSLLLACGALKLSHTISANHGGSILRGNLSVRNIIAP